MVLRRGRPVLLLGRIAGGRTLRGISAAITRLGRGAVLVVVLVTVGIRHDGQGRGRGCRNNVEWGGIWDMQAKGAMQRTSRREGQRFKRR